MKLLTTTKQVLTTWCVLTLVYLVVTVPSLLVSHHLAANLEPYPDGLLYALSARNLVLGKGLQLTHQNTILVPWVPPVYSLVLAAGYLVSTWPTMFVAANILLGVLTIGFVIATVYAVTRSSVAAGLAGLVMVSQAYFLWLPIVPMSENVLLVLIAAGVFLLIKYPGNPRAMVGLAASILGIVLTRYAAVVSAGCLGLLSGWQWYQQSRNKSKLLLLLGSGGLVVGVLLQVLGYAPLALLQTVVTELFQPASTSRYFSWQFIAPNTTFYLRALVGFATQFLWLREPFLTAPLLLLIGVGGYLAWKDATLRWPITVIAVMAVAQAVLPLVFYSQDARYIIGLLPIVAVGLGVSSGGLIRKWGVVTWVVLVFIAIGVQVLSQRHLYRQILAANILGRSTAWQYEAVKHFDATLQPDDYLVTALPPYLVDAYRTQSYIVWPLSSHQEFAQKGNQIWSKPLDFERLPDEVQLLLTSGKNVYITNAYITHQQSVIADYENFKARFILEPVTTGCDQTCNVYRLKLQTTP